MPTLKKAERAQINNLSVALEEWGKKQTKSKTGKIK